MNRKFKILSNEYLSSVLDAVSQGKKFDSALLVQLGDMTFNDGTVVAAEKVGKALDVLSNGGTLSTFNGNNTQDLEGVYSLARSYIVGGQFEKGSKLLKYLCQQDHLNPRNWLAMGKLQILQGEYLESISSFFMGSMVADNDPEFPLCSSEAHFRLDDYDAALSGIEHAQRLYSLHGEENAAVKKRIKVLKSAIDRKINMIAVATAEEKSSEC